MYHFMADQPPDPIRLSFHAFIPGHIRQYLKGFQLEAIRFMYKFLAKGEFCIYNDESGLGKQAAVVVLLNSVCINRKCLIVVQNDDRYVSGWEFHFNVLTNSKVIVIENEKDTTDFTHNVYIAKWSTLRAIGDLCEFKFDFIILDNRGQMLNNSFCTSMLLKNYERKINILISSVDITCDLKLLHNVLRLGGRLDPQYSTFKAFEEKFKLPGAKELAYKRMDLEEYFCKRERLANYCKAFRLRRYCHQFETQLPLVKEDRYKINLDLWRERQNATNSTIRNIDYENNQNHDNEQLRDTQELFEEYCKQRRKQHLQFQQKEEQRLLQKKREMLKSLEGEKQIACNVDDEINLINDTPPILSDIPAVTRDNSDEPVLMSPLMVESDSDDLPEICNDPITETEIVDLLSEGNEEEQRKKNEDNSICNGNIKRTKEDNGRPSIEKVLKRKPFKKRSEVDRLKEDIADRLKIKSAYKRLSRNTRDDTLSPPNRNLKERLEKKIAYSVIAKRRSLNKNKQRSEKNLGAINVVIESEYNSPKECTKSKNNVEENYQEKSKDSSIIPEIHVKENGTRRKNARTLNKKSTLKMSQNKFTSNLNSVKKGKVALKYNLNIGERKNITTTSTSEETSTQNMPNESQTIVAKNIVLVKRSILKAKQIKSTDIQTKRKSGRKVPFKRKMEILPASAHYKQTRSMQRLTRSTSGNKYIRKNLSLQNDNMNKRQKKPIKETLKTTDANKNNKVDVKDFEQTDKNGTMKAIEDKSKNYVKNTQISIISYKNSQDYDSLQCAQRLSDGDVFGTEKIKFLVPPTPNALAKNLLMPSSFTTSSEFLTDSDLNFVPPSNTNNTIINRKNDQVILLSSSDNENSTSHTSSNISAISRRTRALKPKRNQLQTAGEINKAASFFDLLPHQSACSTTKSPDLFSNCSDLVQIPCTQPNVDSEEPNAPFEGFKIFGSEVKQLQQHYALKKNKKYNTNEKQSYRNQRSCLDILEKMFEPSIKKPRNLTDEKSLAPINKSGCVPASTSTDKQKIHTHILPFHPIEAITEARQQQDLQKQKRSTAALSSGSQHDIFEITNNGTFGSVMRLHSNGHISPVQQSQKNNAKQHNKITNYLIGNASHEEAASCSENSGGNINAEAGTPRKSHQHLAAVQNCNVRKSPKCKHNLTQATKLTKWFTKPSELSNQKSTVNSKSLSSNKAPTKPPYANQEIDLTGTASPSLPSTTGKRNLKRRRLDLTFHK